MASVARDPDGRKRIIVAVGGERRTIHLGRVDMKQADMVRIKVAALATAVATGTPIDHATAQWVGGIDGRLHASLARAGLVTPRAQTARSLGELLDTYFSTLHVKRQTAVTYQQTRRSLEEYFGAGKSVTAIAALDAERWRRWLKDDQDLAEPTIAKRVKTARQVFKQALRWKMLTENPFAEVRTGSQTNRARMFFITREVAAKVLDACPDAEWRVIFALSRYGGLRCPSEHLALRWQDVDWAAGRLTVWSSKTEGHDGGAFRIVPLFPELRAILLDAFERAEPGAEFVVARYREPNCNLRTQLLRILSRAGVTPWPKLFHNLRSTRQTELTEEFPAHVVSAWLGNSVVVAQAHYLQVLDRHFDAAVGERPASNVAQNPAQSGAESARNDSQATCEAVAQGAPVPRDTNGCDAVRKRPMTPMGFEPMFSP